MTQPGIPGQAVQLSCCHRNRTAARKSWALLLDAVLQQPGAAQQAAEQQQQQQQLEGQAAQLESAGPVGEAGEAGTVQADGTRATGPSDGKASEQAAAEQGQGALTGWLKRLSSGGLGSRSAASAAAAVSPARDADAGSEAGSEASSQRASQGPSPLRAASLVASASHRRGLSAALDDLAALPPGGDDAAGAAGTAGGAGGAQQAERAAVRAPSPGLRPPRPPSVGASPGPSAGSAGAGPIVSHAAGLAAAVSLGRTSPGGFAEPGLSPHSNNANPSPSSGFVAGRSPSPLLSRVQLLRDSSVVGMPLMLFPDTEEGHLAQASGVWGGGVLTFVLWMRRR